MRVIDDRDYLSPRGNLALWYAFLGAPVVWFIDLGFVYFWVSPSCVLRTSLPLYLIDGVALVLALFALLIGYNIWQDTGEELPGEHATRTDRSRFMAVVGIMMSGLFSLIIAGHILATAILGPCIPLPRVRNTPDTFLQTTQPLYAEAPRR